MRDGSMYALDANARDPGSDSDRPAGAFLAGGHEARGFLWRGATRAMVAPAAAPTLYTPSLGTARLARAARGGDEIMGDEWSVCEGKPDPSSLR